MRIVGGFVLAFAVASISYSQDTPQMQKPDPAKERAKLSFLVGNFSTQTRILPAGKSQKEVVGTGTSAVSWALDSTFLLVNEQSVNPLMGNYKGLGILGYDAHAKEYVLSMFNNFGDRPQYKGSFSGDTLTLISKVEYPGGSFNQKLLWFPEANNVRLTVLNDMGKGFRPVLEQTNTPVK
jgi:hypothetical protein